MKEVVDNRQENKDGSESATSESGSAETSSFIVNSNQSALDTSIFLHDYGGYIDTLTLFRSKNKLAQTDVLQNKHVMIQTSESYSDVSENIDVSLRDKTTSTTVIPFITIVE